MRHLQIYQGAAQAIEFTEKGVIQERCVLCNTAVELCPWFCTFRSYSFTPNLSYTAFRKGRISRAFQPSLARLNMQYCYKKIIIIGTMYCNNNNPSAYLRLKATLLQISAWFLAIKGFSKMYFPSPHNFLIVENCCIKTTSLKLYFCGTCGPMVTTIACAHSYCSKSLV